MNYKGTNRPFVVWAACFLWLTSLFAIVWSLLLFICIGDILSFTGTDLVNAVVLLSGIIMLPTNVYMLCSIANSRKIESKNKVGCCPLWLCIIWIIIINLVGAGLCLHRIYKCRETTAKHLSISMKYYRSVPKYKHFIDNLQWSLKCCGLNSYQDWFSRDWYDKIRDYEWSPGGNKRNSVKQKETTITDSVPLSCCKSGSCISNYLTELGTYSINTNGCGQMMHRIIMTSMNGHLIMFLSVVMVEILILKFITTKDNKRDDDSLKKVNVCHIMPVNDRFDSSSDSYQLNPDDSDMDEANSVHQNGVKVDLSKIASELEKDEE